MIVSFEMLILILLVVVRSYVEQEGAKEVFVTLPRLRSLHSIRGPRRWLDKFSQSRIEVVSNPVLVIYPSRTELGFI